MNSPKARKFRAMREQYFQNLQFEKEQAKPKTRQTVKSTQSNGLSPWGQSAFPEATNLSKPSTAQGCRAPSSKTTTRLFRTRISSYSQSARPYSLSSFHEQFQRLQDKLQDGELIKLQSCQDAVGREQRLFTAREEAVSRNIRRRASLKTRMREFFDKTDKKDQLQIDRDTSMRVGSIIKYPIMVGQANLKKVRRQRQLRAALFTANRFVS